MATDDEQYDYVQGVFKFRKGSTPDRSRGTPGAWRATLRDDEGHLDGQAEFLPRDNGQEDLTGESTWAPSSAEDEGESWAWSDEDEEDYLGPSSWSSSDDASGAQPHQPSEFAQVISAVIIHLIDIAIDEARPHLTKWWNETALPAFRSARESRRRKVAPVLKIDRQAPTDGQPARVFVVGPVVRTGEPGVGSDEQTATMTSAEAQRRLVAAALARAFSDEQVRILLTARIEDPADSSDWATLDQASPEEVESRIRLVLEANPPLLNDLVETFMGDQKETPPEPVRQLRAPRLPTKGLRRAKSTDGRPVTEPPPHLGD